jgi:hypothetical protein
VLHERAVEERTDWFEEVENLCDRSGRWRELNESFAIDTELDGLRRSRTWLEFIYTAGDDGKSSRALNVEGDACEERVTVRGDSSISVASFLWSLELGRALICVRTSRCICAILQVDGRAHEMGRKKTREEAEKTLCGVVPRLLVVSHESLAPEELDRRCFVNA